MFLKKKNPVHPPIIKRQPATKPAPRRPDSEIHMPYRPFVRLGQLLPTLWVALLLLTAPALYVWQASEVSRLKYEIRQLSQQGKELIKRNGDLQIRISDYGSPERMEKLYRSKYGYVPVSGKLRVITLRLPEDPEQKLKKHQAGSSLPQKAVAAMP